MDEMWFYDEAGELEEFQDFRKEAQQQEKEYLEMRVALRDAEAALAANPANEELKALVEQLKKELRAIEKQSPWISSDVPVEVLLWGVPHG